MVPLLQGSFSHYLLDVYNANEYWRLFFFTGFLGAYTTFSSYAAETLMMLEQGQWLKVLTNILVNNVGALVMVIVGTLLARYMLLHLMQQSSS